MVSRFDTTLKKDKGITSVPSSKRLPYNRQIVFKGNIGSANVSDIYDFKKRTTQLVSRKELRKVDTKGRKEDLLYGTLKLPQ